MGILTGRENIIKAVGYVPPVLPENVIKSFEIFILNLIGEASIYIKTPDATAITDIDEPQISLSLHATLNNLVSKKELQCGVSWEHFEVTDKVEKNVKTARRFDIFFENWDVKNRMNYGVEAKILIENNSKKRTAVKLVEKYVSEAGMGKYINGIYKGRGCMLGYVLEGNVSSIISKINSEICAVFDNSQCLSKVSDPQLTYSDVYRSEHKAKLSYPLFHLMLDFTCNT